MGMKAYLTESVKNLDSYNIKCYFRNLTTRCQSYLHSKLVGNGFSLNNETSTDGEGGEYEKRDADGRNKKTTCLNMHTDDETYDDMSNTYSQNYGGNRSADCTSSCESQVSSQANDAVIYNSGIESVYNDSILSESASVTRTAATPPPAPPPPPVPYSKWRRESPGRKPSIRRQHKTIHEDDEEEEANERNEDEVDEVHSTDGERDHEEEEEMEYKRNTIKDGEEDDDDWYAENTKNESRDRNKESGKKAFKTMNNKPKKYRRQF